MSITTPPTLTAPPSPPPSRTDPVNFASRSDAYHMWRITNHTEEDAVIAWTYATATEVNSLATAASGSASSTASDRVQTGLDRAATSADVLTLAPINADLANINAVSGDLTNINTVAGIAGIVTTVAGVSANVTTVAGSIESVNTVSGSISSVNNASANIASIIASTENAATASTKSGLAASSASAASASALSATASASAAHVSELNAVSVVTGGTASLTAAATKMPISDSGSLIDASWLENNQSYQKHTESINYAIDIAGHAARYAIDGLATTNGNLATTNGNLATTNGLILNDETQFIQLHGAVQYAIDIAGKASAGNIALPGGTKTGTSIGNPGNVAFDGTNLYICVSSGSWKKLTLATI